MKNLDDTCAFDVKFEAECLFRDACDLVDMVLSEEDIQFQALEHLQTQYVALGDALTKLASTADTTSGTNGAKGLSNDDKISS